MQLSTMSTCAVPAPPTTLLTQRITLTKRLDTHWQTNTHMCPHKQTWSNLQHKHIFWNHHTSYAATQPVRARSCDCLLLLFEIWEGEQHWADNVREFECVNSRERPYQHLLSSITCSRGKGTGISKVYVIIATTTAPPTGGQQNNTQQDKKW